MTPKAKNWSNESRQTKASLSDFARDESGLAAIEFALLAPVLLLAFLAMTDFGFAVYERMRLDQITREAAAASMSGASTTTLDALVAAEIANLGGTIGGNPITYTAPTLSCSCPGSETAVVCQTICVGDEPTQVFMSISVNLVHDAFILGDFNLNSTLRVQTR